MSLPRILVTGASGFVGRHLLDVFKDHYRIYGLARRSQARSGAPVHPNITWYQTDIAERDNLERVFSEIAEDGGATILIHLAACYPDEGFAPAAGTPAHAAFLRWIIFTNVNIYEATLRQSYPFRYTSDPNAHDATRDAAIARMGEALVW